MTKKSFKMYSNISGKKWSVLSQGKEKLGFHTTGPNAAQRRAVRDGNCLCPSVPGLSIWRGWKVATTTERGKAIWRAGLPCGEVPPSETTGKPVPHWLWQEWFGAILKSAGSSGTTCLGPMAFHWKCTDSKLTRIIDEPIILEKKANGKQSFYFPFSLAKGFGWWASIPSTTKSNKRPFHTPDLLVITELDPRVGFNLCQLFETSETPALRHSLTPTLHTFTIKMPTHLHNCVIH